MTHATLSRAAALTIIGATFAAMVVPIASAQGANLIQNPSLESMDAAGGPANWTKTSWGNITANFNYPIIGRGRNGGTTASITVTGGTTGDARWMHAPVAVTPGATYTFTGWYKSDVETEIDMLIEVGRRDRDVYEYLGTIPASGEWRQVSFVISIPARVTKVTIFHLLDKVGSLAIDDYSLTLDGTTAPPPTRGSVGMVSLSFDDAWLSQYEIALPLLENADVSGTFYLTAAPLIENNWSGFMQRTHVIQLAGRGHEIADHTITHRDLASLSDDEIRREVGESKSFLESLAGKPVTSIAYPYGSVNSNIKSIVRSLGYTTGRGVDYTQQNTPSTDRLELKSQCLEQSHSLDSIKQQILNAQNNKTWYILCIHEVKENPGQYDISAATLQGILAYIREVGIVVVTVSEGAARQAAL